MSEVDVLTNSNYSSKYLIIMTKGKSVFIYAPRNIFLTNEYKIEDYFIKITKV